MRMVLFAISSKLIFTHFIYHTLLFIIPSSFNSYFTSITLITTHPCFSLPFAFLFFMHSFPSLSSSQPLQSISLLSISIAILSFHSISSFLFICYFSFDSSFSHVLCYSVLSLSTAFILFIQSYPHFSFPFISFLRYSSSFLYYVINAMFVRFLIISLSFGVLIENTLSQLDPSSYVSNV